MIERHGRRARRRSSAPGRRAGRWARLPATIYRRRRPPSRGRVGRGRRRPGRCPRPSARQVLEVLHSERFVDVRRRRPRRRCWTRAPTCARRARCTGSSPPSTAVCASGAISSPTRLREARAARRAAERAVVLGRLEAQGPGEVDLLLPVRDPRRVQPLRRRLDGPVPRERPARQGADRAGRPNSSRSHPRS